MSELYFTDPSVTRQGKGNSFTRRLVQATGTGRRGYNSFVPLEEAIPELEKLTEGRWLVAVTILPANGGSKKPTKEVKATAILQAKIDELQAKLDSVKPQVKAKAKAKVANDVDFDIEL